MSASVFPARAGMSPFTPAIFATSERVPRASGDEPSGPPLFYVFRVCSPRERG